MTSRDLAVLTITALAAAVTGTVIGVLAVLVILTVAGDSDSLLPVAVVLRTAFVGVSLYLLVRIVRRRSARQPVASGYARVDASAVSVPTTAIILGGIAGGLLDPFMWGGRALAGQLVAGAGPVAVALDLVLWTCIVVLGVRAPLPNATSPGFGPGVGPGGLT
jgi:hypothetical protein